MSAAESENGKGGPDKVNPVADMLDLIDAEEANLAAMEVEHQKRKDDVLAAQKARDERHLADIRQALLLRLGRQPTQAEVDVAEVKLFPLTIRYGSLLNRSAPKLWAGVKQSNEPTASTATPTVASEKAAILSLAKKLLADPNMTREVAIAHCVTNHGISKRAAQYRVWSKAREMAGLPAQGSPGAKKKIVAV